MGSAIISRTAPILGTLLGTVFGGWVVVPPAIAVDYPPCQPPSPNEYLLLVVNQDSNTQAELEQLLPASSTSTVCNYLDDDVVRVGGFTDVAVANSWAQYLNDIGGLPTFVARPAASGATPVAQPGPVGAPAAYNPSPMPAGYAVLVSYFNRTEIAAELQQLLGSPVGLVAYGQQPYLLAAYTPDAEVANMALRALSDRDFLAMIVDSRRVVLLAPAVTATAR